MTSLAYLLPPKWSDAAVLTSSATLANSPIGNVQNPQPRIRTIFTSGACFIEGDFGVARTINSYFLGFITSLSSADTRRFRCKNSYPVTSSPLIDISSTIWPTGSNLSAYKDKHCQVEFAQQTARYFRIDLSCSVAPEISRLVVGKRIEPVNSVMAWTADASEPVIGTIDYGNQETRRSVGSRRMVHLEWPPALSKLESLGSASIYELLLERGVAKDYVVALNHGDDEIISPMAYIYVGCGLLKVPFNTLNHLFSATLDLTEMAPLRML